MKARNGLRIGGTAVGLAIALQATASLTLSPLAHADTTMKAKSPVYVRTGPSSSFPSIAVLGRGEEVVVNDTTDNGWAAVTYHGEDAYVYEKYLTHNSTSLPAHGSAARGTVYTTTALNVRAKPEVDSSLLGAIPEGSEVTLTGRISGEYAQIIWKDAKRWVATSYLTENAPSKEKADLPKIVGKGTAIARLMIRTTSDSSFTSLGTVPYGTVLDRTGVVKNERAQVIWQGTVRWVNNNYLVADDEGATPKADNSKAEGSKNDNSKAKKAKSTSAKTTASRKASSSRGDINKGGSSGLNKTNSKAQAIAWYVWDNYPEIKTMYGWRKDRTPDHPAGRAVDVMIPNYRSDNAIGYKIAEFFKDNAQEFGVNYIIWNQRIWSVQRNSEGWRPMSGRGNDSANHKDHVHINTY